MIGIYRKKFQRKMMLKIKVIKQVYSNRMNDNDLIYEKINLL